VIFAVLSTHPTRTAGAAAARRFVVDTSSSKVDFLMKAPIENIHGVGAKSIHGELMVDSNDLSATRGQIKIDLDQLEVFQSKLDEETGAFTEETKSEKQNNDMRAWFEISDDVPAGIRERNRWITFDIEDVLVQSGNDLAQLQGVERKIKARISGNFTLHGHSEAITADVNLSFRFDGDELESIRVSSAHPVQVNLARYDVRPRSAFEKLAAKTLGALGQKVAESAPVAFSFALTPG
jgi:polyisoprenoid-binding protein YceI